MAVRIAWAGVDEAGRGPLAGPVVAAAVILPRSFDVAGIDDSKKMAPAARESAAERIKRKAVYCIQFADVEEIDRINILQASLLAMRRAVTGLAKAPKGALVDGNQPIKELDCAVKCVVKGDAKYAQIAAASILAKTHRDALMREQARAYPEYGFDHNFGYYTPEHITAIRAFGPCPLHRRSFSPVKEMFEQPCLEIGV